MHLRLVSSKAKGKTYKYAQLVESFRREDGRPAVRVVKHLGKLDGDVFNALRVALEAGRTGDAIFTEVEVRRLLSGSTLANLRYLDLSVLMKYWDQWGLSALLDELVGETRAKLPFSEVTLALTLQRCCAPGSKLQATRWIPTTALPELRGFDPSVFHGSRIHRALERLFEITPTLQERLSEKYVLTDGRHGVLFMDVTDTYFEGIGCPMAEQTRTKTEMPHKRCLGIVLLANERGYPLRWKVVGGKTKDWHAMNGMLEELGDIDWLRETPVVFDRAMGNQKTVAELKQAKALHFLTAAHITSIDSYTKQLPFEAVYDVGIEGTDESYQQDIEQVAKAARDAEFEQVDSRLFVIELGVALPAAEQEAMEKEASPRKRRGRKVLAAKHLKQARRVRDEMKRDKSLRFKDMAARLGVTRKHLANQLALLELAPAVQDRILLLGDLFPIGEKELRTLLEIPRDEQLRALEEKLADNDNARHKTRKQSNDENSKEDSPILIGSLRMVAYFNPQLFVDIRRRSASHCVKLQQHVSQFNEELALAKRSRDYNVTYRRFEYEVERLGYRDLFDIELTPLKITSKTGLTISSFQGSIIRKEEAWKRRRRYDGFVLLLGHPELPHTARQLVDFYRVKDTVEKDFQTIKSCIKMRPIYSYTDPKVEAHVTVCMLALLLQRTLESMLQEAGKPRTARACIEILKTCHLNQRRSDSSPLYDITQPSAEQCELLEVLNLGRLAEDEYLRAQITPRPSSMPLTSQSKRKRRRSQ